MKDKLLQIKVDTEFISELDYLKKVRNYKSNADAIRHIVWKEYYKEKRPTAFWIERKNSEESEGKLISNYECSNCRGWFRDKSNFCPDCGFLMEKPN